MWLRRLDRRRRLYIVPYQWNWVLDAVGLTEAECQQAAWAITPDGQKYRGAAGINQAIDAIVGIGGIGYGFYKIPVVGKLQDGTYQWIANNRKRFPGTTPSIRQEPPWQPE